MSDTDLSAAPHRTAASVAALARGAVSDAALAIGLSAEANTQVDRIGHCDIAVGLLTYNNADTVKAVADTVVLGLEKHFPSVSAAFVNADAGSSDGTPALVAGAGLPTVSVAYDTPPAERVSVPFHGVPGRAAGLRQTFSVAHRLGARVAVLVEADLTSITEEWIRLLAAPVLDHEADFVSPVYARHRYDSTITSLIMSPLMRALYGRRLHRPLGGQQALSGRLLDHLLIHPKWSWSGRDVSDLWIVGTAIADGFAVWEAHVGPRTIKSATRTTELPAMIAQTLGSAFTLMDRHAELWLETRGSQAVPAVGEPTPPSVAPIAVDVERMIEAFRLGLRDLTPIWEHILAPETLSEVLTLDAAGDRRFTFPDDLWARVVYDFALGHHYNVIHREHLLRSFVALYLGRTAAFVLATQRLGADASRAMTEAVDLAFERQKPYLVERWR